jgi:mannitol 2-dehydrogenase
MRLLNGAHSAIGYAADLLGHRTIADAVGDPLLHELLIRFMAEVRPTLQQLPGIDLDAYSASIVKRFSNAAIRDQVARICSGGCAKIAKFIVPSLADLLESRTSPGVLTFVIASWLHYLRGTDESGRALSISDPGLERMQPFLAAGASDARLALSVRPLFGELAFTHPQLVSAVQSALDKLRTDSVRETLAQTLGKVQIR